MTQTVNQLRVEALRLFDVAVKAADPAKALRKHFDQTPIHPPSGTLLIVAVGKAAVPMLEETLAHIPSGTPHEAIAVTNRENFRELHGAHVLPAGHPVPDAEGEFAGKHVMKLLDAAQENDHIIALISGGGSALLPAPIDGVSLRDKARVSELLLSAGCDIERMNEVRQQLSQLKGGGFLRHAAPCAVEAFILSDVVGDDLRAIASGPTVAPMGTRKSAKTILEKFNIFSDMPDSVKVALAQPNIDVPRIAAKNLLICSNRQSLEAMANAYDGNAVIVNDRLDGNVADVGPALVDIVRNMPVDEPLALIFGGETTVTLTGDGMGGRNQDLALRFALEASEIDGDWVFMSGGTDGRDGPTDAAGGLVDPNSISRMKNAGQDPEKMLENNDAYNALKASDDLIITGGTGTNVADVQLFLRA
jgi:hydroxypyruvate reductase